MTIDEALKTASPELAPGHLRCIEEKNLGRLEAEVLLAHILKKDRAWLLSHPNYQLSTINYKQFRSFVSRRKRHEPIAYILGEKEFYGLTFKVNRHALIPRPETELIVDLALKKLCSDPSPRDLVWDVGTGSGAIALAVAAKIKQGGVLATDSSTPALNLARLNAKRLGVRRATFLKASLLTDRVKHYIHKKNPKRLIITANLPYLPLSDKRRLDPDVARFEPSSALFARDQGRGLIKKILRQVADSDLRPQALFIEFDPPQTKTLRAYAEKKFFAAVIKIHRDLSGRDRVMEISAPSA